MSFFCSLMIPQAVWYYSRQPYHMVVTLPTKKKTLPQLSTWIRLRLPQMILSFLLHHTNLDQILMNLLTLKLLRINDSKNHQQTQLLFASCILLKNGIIQNIMRLGVWCAHIMKFQNFLTSFVLRYLITSSIPAYPKTRACSSCASSRSPRSLIVE